MRFSTGLVGGALIAGVLGAVPAFAGTPASISGSATLATPAGFVSTVSGESVLASGSIFNTSGSTITPATAVPVGGAFDPNAQLSQSAVIVVPTYSIAGGGTFVANSLSVGSAASVTTTGSSSFSAAAATILTNTSTALAGSRVLANTDFINAVIKSGAGVNGLD